jgi:hypothetical protein
MVNKCPHVGQGALNEGCEHIEEMGTSWGSDHEQL